MMEADDAVIFCLSWYVINAVPRGNLGGSLSVVCGISEGGGLVCAWIGVFFVHLSVLLVCRKAADELPDLIMLLTTCSQSAAQR